METTNQLQVIVQQSGLEPTKAEIILANFQDYFKIAAEWESKAKNIIVTDASQKEDMAMARIGRLFLREKRITIEKRRKELKEQSIREGKAIEGIANVLKALIEPIEEYLDKQEHFVEIKEAAEKEQIRIEAEKKAEADRLAAEEAERVERERIKAENERLRLKMIEQEKALELERKATAERERIAEEKARAEREAAEKIIATERAKAEAKKKAAAEKADAERRVIEERARKERAALEQKAAEERQKAEAEKKKAADEYAKKQATERAKAEAEKKERERLEKILANTITCPHCKKTFVLERK